MSDYITTISLGNSNKSLSLEDYQGKLSLVSTWESNKGTKPNWCFRQERVKDEATGEQVNKPGKAIPLKLLLGSKAEAVSLLLQLLAALGHPVSGKPADDDIGF